MNYSHQEGFPDVNQLQNSPLKALVVLSCTIPLSALTPTAFLHVLCGPHTKEAVSGQSRAPAGSDGDLAARVPCSGSWRQCNCMVSQGPGISSTHIAPP